MLIIFFHSLLRSSPEVLCDYISSIYNADNEVKLNFFNMLHSKVSDEIINDFLAKYEDLINKFNEVHLYTNAEFIKKDGNIYALNKESEKLTLFQENLHDVKHEIKTYLDKGSEGMILNAKGSSNKLHKVFINQNSTIDNSKLKKINQIEAALFLWLTKEGYAKSFVIPRTKLDKDGHFYQSIRKINGTCIIES